LELNCAISMDGINKMQKRFWRLVVVLAYLLSTTVLFSIEIGMDPGRVGDHDPARSIVYVDGLELLVCGKLHDERNYVRLPEKYKNIVRSPVWNLSKHSAGISIKFSTDSPEIWAKW